MSYWSTLRCMLHVIFCQWQIIYVSVYNIELTFCTYPIPSRFVYILCSQNDGMYSWECIIIINYWMISRKPYQKAHQNCPLQKLSPVFNYEFLHLLSSVNGWRFYDGNSGSYQSDYRGSTVMVPTSLLLRILVSLSVAYVFVDAAKFRGLEFSF